MRRRRKREDIRAPAKVTRGLEDRELRKGRKISLPVDRHRKEREGRKSTTWGGGIVITRRGTYQDHVTGERNQDIWVRDKKRT